MNENTTKKATRKEKGGNIDLIAKKDWHILSGKCNKKTGNKYEIDIKISKGQKVDVPEAFMRVLKVEGVI